MQIKIQYVESFKPTKMYKLVCHSRTLEEAFDSRNENEMKNSTINYQKEENLKIRFVTRSDGGSRHYK